MESIIDQIKDRITVPAYLSRECQIQPRGNRSRSFRPDASNPSSLLVNERDWFDFGTGEGGDVINLAAAHKFNGDKGAAIRYLADAYGIRGETEHIDIAFRAYERILDLVTEFYHSNLKANHITYLDGRGITKKTIDELRIGWAENPCEFLKNKGFLMEQIADTGILSFINRLMIPYMRNNKTTYLLGRASVWEDQPSSNPERKYMKMYRNELSEHPIWGIESLRREGTVIIAEGIFDAIACWQEGYPVVTAVTGHFSNEQKKDLFPSLKGREVIICMDYDPVTKAGQKFTETLALELFELGIHVSCVMLEGGKNKVDLNDIYAANPNAATLATLFAGALPWEKITLDRIKAIESIPARKEKLTEFLRRCAAVFDWPTVAQLIEDAKSLGVPEAWLSALAKTLKAPPSDDRVVKDFCKKFDCVFNEQLGWYEYNESVWVRIQETEIKSRVANLFGQHRTSNRVNSVYQLLRGELIYTDKFDSHPNLINFPNGMLDINTGKLLAHSRDYYSAIQLDYNFDATATCPAWITFIQQVTADDEKRQALIQEMFGYCFTRDAKYQKCFSLIGDGANGKSVLLHILKSLVGATNTSHVEIASLESAFERICLHNKLVNIASETKSDVRGTEAIFKQIVAGDPINGCYKGKDFVSFAPFCKMIFAANEHMQSKDMSYGFLRRICFIRFPMRFVDTPNGVGESKKDPALASKLSAELPGIFNWALLGLKELRRNDSFSVTSDQTEMMYEFMILSNPLVSFCEECLSDDKWYKEMYAKREIYKEYEKWAIDTHTCIMSARSFWPRLRQVIAFKEVRGHHERNVVFTKKV